MITLRIISQNSKQNLAAISQLPNILHCAQQQQQRCYGTPISKTATDVSEQQIKKQLNQLWASRCNYCTVRAIENEQPEDGLIKRVLKKVRFTPNSKARLQVASRVLYESVADKINYLDFFNDFKLPNTFNSWFLVTELHVWMLLVRAMGEGAESGEDGRFLRNCIVEAMWADVNMRAKKLGSTNSSIIRKQIEELSEQFQAALISYDEGLMSDDRILAAALWRRFFVMNDCEYEQIERLVMYVRKQMNILDGLTTQEFTIKPKIPWSPLRDLKV